MAIIGRSALSKQVASLTKNRTASDTSDNDCIAQFPDVQNYQIKPQGQRKGRVG